MEFAISSARLLDQNDPTIDRPTGAGGAKPMIKQCYSHLSIFGALIDSGSDSEKCFVF